MAFFCPAGFPRHRRRRHTGQNNVQSNDETEKNDRKAVETEFEPTKMVVVRDFSPCVDDELEVKRGQHVKALYQENEWRFVVAEDGKEGFIPYTYCIPIADKNRKPMSKHRDENIAVPRLSEMVGNVQRVVPTIAASSSSSSETDIKVHHVPAENEFLQDFVKKHLGQYTVLFDYNAIQEDDISTHRGETVTVLNKDDPDWYWVRTEDGTREDGTREGFIPRKYLKPMQEVNSFGPTRRNVSEINDSHIPLPLFLNEENKMRYGVKQLIAIRKYFSQGKRELTIEKGEKLFTDDSHTDKLAWLWVYSPQSRERGFVPNSHVRWSQNTTFL